MTEEVKEEWKKVRLGEVAEVYDDRRIPLSSLKRQEMSGEYPYYGASGIIDYVNDYIFDGVYLLVSEDGNNLISRNTPIAFLAKGKFWVNNHAHVIKGKNDFLDTRFVMYWIESNDISGYITGTAQPKLSQLNLLNIGLIIPSFPTQKKIAAILSAYDDLIENNTRRIKILEEMAQTIYKEWFVKFRFPGYEKVKMVDSELGQIPEGWEVKRLGDVAEIFKGKSYKSSEISKDGGLPFANLKCIARGGGFRKEGLKRYSGKYNETQVVRDGDIVVAVTDMSQKREVVGRVAHIPRRKEEKMIISLDLVKVLSVSDLNKDYMYCLLRYSDFGDTVKQYANGVNVLHLNPEVIKDYIFVLPSSDLIIAFGEISNKIFQQIDILGEKNTNLRHARDLLLPKLISGEIDVGDMIINTEVLKIEGGKND